ncbi:MAG: hypothetical protein Q8O90_07560, partial [Elusimicrobiota bacterium]|nr:hypothetical protein [Elusimicrobiota bacterium]
MKKFFILLALGVVCAAAAAAEDAPVLGMAFGVPAAPSEDEMFSTPEVVTQAAGAPGEAEEKKTLGFSGEVISVLEDVVYSSAAGNPFNSYIVGNLMLDARLKNGVKAFANMETAYYSKTRETDSVLREAFLDF